MATDERLVEGTFKKCDMHVHSSSCYSRSYDEASFSSSILESDLDVIAVTDHNSIDTDLLKRLHSAISKIGKTLVGGVEINIKLKQSTIDAYHLLLGDGKNSDYFHAIVWFSLEHAAEMSKIVKELFIGTILRESDESDMTEEALRSLSHKEFSKQTEGMAIYLEDFQEKASSIPYFFVPHENKDRSLSEYLPNGTRAKPLKANQDYKDRLFYYSHAMAVEGGEKSRKHISEGLARELNTTVAALFFSDAMNADEIGSKFTWIDFDGDLDSLLLAISDPESRIKTSDAYETLPQSNTTSFLESVSFNMYTDTVADGSEVTTLHFSPGYNGVVGSRGSGKSLLACLLAGEGLDTYSEFVDPDSVKFTTRGGIPSKDHPACLYLGQGELEGIYKNGQYEGIPFLGNHVTPLRAKAEKEANKARKRLNEILDLEKKLLLTFCSKYSSVVHFDHLDAEMPSGITILAPQYPSKDQPKVNQAQAGLVEIEESLETAVKVANSISFKNSYPENEKLFSALECEARAIDADLITAKDRIARFSLLLKEVDPAWFADREQLMSLFAITLSEYNSSSDSTTLTQYNEKTAKVAAFLDDLYEMRLTLEYLNAEAKKAYEKMHEPINPIELQNDEESIAINLTYNEDVAFEDRYCDLLGGSSGRNQQTLVEAFLIQSDREKMHKKFNGNKFRPCVDRGVTEHYKRFFDQLKDAVNGSTALETKITVDGKPIDDMSPGMKAQALLKLFLNDEVVKGKWTYIVLDQPEDNLDVATIKEFLIDRLKNLKLNVQFFVVSHSAPVIINGDARTVVVCKNSDGEISYTQGAMNEHSVKQSIADVLDGGERYLKMRLNKYNFQVGDE